MPSTPALAAWLPENQENIIETLSEWVKIPSVAAVGEPKNLQASAAFASKLLHQIGMRQATILDSVSAPAAYAEWTGAGEDAPTVLFVGHHDVVPANNPQNWSHSPFEGTVIGDTVVGRGALSGKGAALAGIESIRGLMETNQTPLINLKVLIVGDSSIGAPTLPALLAAEADRLKADVIVAAISGAAHDSPTVLVGTRGQVLVDLELRTADRDGAVANYGGTLPNPGLLLARLLSDLVDTTGQVTLPGFYHRVRQLSERGRAVLREIAFDETEWRSYPGANLITGESGFSPLERLAARPSLDVVSFYSGDTTTFHGPSIPAAASARIAMSLVPDQHKDEIVVALRSWLEARIDRGITANVGITSSIEPSIANVDSAPFGALVAATKAASGTQPVLSRFGGRGISDALIDAMPDAEMLMVPVGGPRSLMNSTNENLNFSDLATAATVFGELWPRLAAAS